MAATPAPITMMFDAETPAAEMASCPWAMT